jgi:uncharacterized protein (TIGR03000 family)
MRGKILFGLALTALTFLFTADTTQAQRFYRGGWDGYGYRAPGYYRGWYGRPYYNNYRWDNYGWGSYGPYYGWGAYRPYYGWGSYWPYTYSGLDSMAYPSVTYSYPSTTIYSSEPVVPSTLSSSPITYASYSQESANLGNKAQVDVGVPMADTRLWFNGEAAQQTGTERRFFTPPLEPGKEYTYTIRASWRNGDREVTREQVVTVRAGEETSVRF